MRPQLPLGIENVAALIDAPAEVVAFADEKDLLPEILAVVANPDVARFWIDRESPRIPESVSPRFGHDPVLANERVVLGHAVCLAFGRMIDVDPQQLGRELRQVLA